MLRTVTAEEAAARLIAITALDERVRRLQAAVTAQLRDLTVPGTTLRPANDGKPMGVVTHKPGPRKAIVVNAEAFAWWVREHYPGQVQLVPAAQNNTHHEGPLNMALEVRRELKDQVLALSEEAGEPAGPGGESGADAPAGIRVEQQPGEIVARPFTDAITQRLVTTLLEELLVSGPSELPNA
jgi:hypothetical protein